MSFKAHRIETVKKMLEEIGAKSIEDLFASIPEELKFRGDLNLPEGTSEKDARAHVHNVLERNKHLFSYRSSFMGCGVYLHYVPSVVDHIASLPGFVTPYTPYQAEASQGILQSAFEFQSMIAELMNLDVVNSSLYDGSTAVAEAVLMGLRVSGGRRVLTSEGLNPLYRQVIETYLMKSDVELKSIPLADSGLTSPERAEFHRGDVVVIQSPNFYGVIENLPEWGRLAEEQSLFLIHTFTEALSLAVLKTPGESGAHVSAGEGASFGLYPSFGGPLLGLFGTRMKYVRQMPGRLIGETVDITGKRAFVMTLATREQHIRREKATSNVCTNVQLNALRAAVYLSLMGPNLKKLAMDNASRAHYLLKLLLESPGIKQAFSGEFFNEFTLILPKSAEEVYRELREQGFICGVPAVRVDENLDEKMLIIAVTEMNDVEKIEEFARVLRKVTR